LLAKKRVEMNKKSILDIDLKGKRVFMRADFNVPLNNALEITDDSRIKAAIPTIEAILAQGASLILSSHLGRPKGERKAELSLKPVAKRLTELLGKKVALAPDCIGEAVQAQKAALSAGELLLLENLRYYKEETANDARFAAQLIAGCDVFVNDAFGTAHRAHASTSGVSEHVKISVSGLLIDKEINFLSSAIDVPKRPLVAIIGGAKISGKIDVITELLNKVDAVLVGGGMVFTFYRAMGISIGKSLLEEDKIELARELIASAKEKNVRLLLPTDLVCADAFANDANRKTTGYTEIPENMMGLDIGPKSIDLFSGVLADAKTVIWNGPMGAFEMPNFAAGTKAIAEQLAKITKQGATTIIGGGDSAAAINQFALNEQMSHISTGGGASLELLEGKSLAGIDALTDK
jgi:phosphoglycerate kinase